MREYVERFQMANHLLSAAIAEGVRRREGQGMAGVYCGWECDALVSKMSSFFKAFCRALSAVERAKTDPVLERMAAQAAAMVATARAIAVMPEAWPVAKTGHGWEVDFLELDYQVRAHLDPLLTSLVAFARECLARFLTEWEGWLASEEAPPVAVSLTRASTAVAPRAETRLPDGALRRGRSLLSYR